ncbi:MAG: hypothetical protein M1817_005553 [Caeruleum heppii]|nr:MAG: hypothetical protein M1817_005553 [Caeruleum heppii]
MALSSLGPTLQATDDFLAPVLKGSRSSQTTSIIETLSNHLRGLGVTEAADRSVVISKALQLLSGIQTDLASKDTSEGSSAPDNDTFDDPHNRRLVYGLLDLITLEGIYPLLSPGVGIPLERRVRSVLATGLATTNPSPTPEKRRAHEEVRLLREIVDCLHQVLQHGLPPLSSILRERSLVDVISATGELAYSPYIEEPGIHSRYKLILTELLDEYVGLFADPLNLLLHRASPSWLRGPVSRSLSLLPLRPQGVRQTIDFIASGTTTSSDLAAVQGRVPSGPSLSLDTMTRASRLLSSVPSSVPPESYFLQLRNQLYPLLDGEAGPEMAKAASLVISSGILGRRMYGAPGQAGWMVFAAPLLADIDPNVERRGKPDVSTGPQLRVVGGNKLKLALTRLTTLLSSHPNPGLTKRLLSPLLISLWALLCFARSQQKEDYFELAFSLLLLYLKLTATIEPLIRLSSRLMFDGGHRSKDEIGWKFVTDLDGGIKINSRSADDEDLDNLLERAQSIDGRLQLFVLLLRSSTPNDVGVSDLFLRLTKDWLLPVLENPPTSLTVQPTRDGDEVEPLQSLVRTKLVQKMLEEFREQLSGSTLNMLELVKHLLDSFIKQHDTLQKRHEALKKPSIVGLGDIVMPRQASPSTSDAEGPAEVVTIALSILSTIISSSVFEGSTAEDALFSSIQPSLAFIANLPKLPTSVSSTASNLSHIIPLISNSSGSTDIPSATADTVLEDRKTHSLALTYLTDELPPVRAQGLSLLTKLINRCSPLIDVPSTMTLLVSLLQDTEEFIYLNAIKALCALADRHSKTVASMLMERYMDQEESFELDQRLRLGEAILGIVERLGRALTGETAQIIADGCAEIASRRPVKPRKAERNRQNEELSKARQSDAEEAWGGEIPQLPTQEDEQAEDPQMGALHARILASWSAAPQAEDFRIRTSALSIFGVAVETNIAGLGSALTSSGIDLSLSILTLERGDEAAILRRAGVRALLAVIQALEKAEEEGKHLSFGLDAASVGDVSRVLGYVADMDGDEMVRGNAKVVGEMLDGWMRRRVLGGMRGRQDGGLKASGLNLGTERLGGLVAMTGHEEGRPKIEEIE